MQHQLADTSSIPTMAPTSSFPFLSLPPEIRMMIYRYLLSKKLIETVVHIKEELFRQPKRCSRDKANPTVPTRLSSQLLRVCRKIYHEAIAILYSELVSATWCVSIQSR